MNKLIYILSATVLIAVLAVSGCKSDDDATPDPLAEQLTALMNAGSDWVVGSSGHVMKDGFDVSDQFAGFKLTIGNGTYSTQNSLSHVWSPQGTWEFVDSDPNRVLRNDGVELAVRFNANNLTLTFTAPDSDSGGRTEGVAGEYQFVLVSE